MRKGKENTTFVFFLVRMCLDSLFDISFFVCFVCRSPLYGNNCAALLIIRWMPIHFYQVAIAAFILLKIDVLRFLVLLSRSCRSMKW